MKVKIEDYRGWEIFSNKMVKIEKAIANAEK